MSAAIEKTAGVITFGVAGITATLGHEDVAAWGAVLISLAPLILIMFLIWRIYKMDQQHKECQRNYEELQQSQQRMQEQILATFLAVKHPTVCKNLPSVEEFKNNAFDVPTH